MTSLHVQQLAHHYGDARSLSSISFTLQGAGITGLLGRNGAGKSTLLRLLAGQLLPTHGEVRAGALTTAGDGLAWRAQVGFLPERPALHDDETTGQMIMYHLGLHGIFGKLARAACDEFIDRCELREVRHTRIAELSFGFKKRVGLACTLSHRPPIVLLDEPGAGLDPAQLIALREIVTHISATQLVILSSHALQEIALMTPHMLVLHEGRLITHTREDSLASEVLLDEHSRTYTLTIASHQAEAARHIASAHAEITRTLHHDSLVSLNLWMPRERAAGTLRDLLDAQLDVLAWRTLGAHDDLEARFMAWTGRGAQEEE